MDKHYFQIPIAKANWKPSIIEVDYLWNDWLTYKWIQFEWWASTEDRDRWWDITLASSFLNTLPTYMQNSIIFLQHDAEKPIWSIIEASVVEWQWLYVKGIVKIDTDDVFKKVRTWVIKTMSFGYKILDYWVLKENIDWVETETILIKEVELFEISLVSVPMNANAMVKENMTDEEYKSLFKLDAQMNYDLKKSLIDTVKELKIAVKEEEVVENPVEVEILEEKKDEIIEGTVTIEEQNIAEIVWELAENEELIEENLEKIWEITVEIKQNEEENIKEDEESIEKEDEIAEEKACWKKKPKKKDESPIQFKKLSLWEIQSWMLVRFEKVIEDMYDYWYCSSEVKVWKIINIQTEWDLIEDWEKITASIENPIIFIQEYEMSVEDWYLPTMEIEWYLNDSINMEIYTDIKSNNESIQKDTEIDNWNVITDGKSIENIEIKSVVEVEMKYSQEMKALTENVKAKELEMNSKIEELTKWFKNSQEEVKQLNEAIVWIIDLVWDLSQKFKKTVVDWAFIFSWEKKEVESVLTKKLKQCM